MRTVELSGEQIAQLVDSWLSAEEGSVEKKLIEDLFIITDSILPKLFVNGSSRSRQQFTPTTAQPLEKGA